MKIEIRKIELDLLTRLTKISRSVDWVLERVDNSEASTVSLTLSSAELEKFADNLHHLLASIGFDEEYGLTPLGEEIEQLIDKLDEILGDTLSRS